MALTQQPDGSITNEKGEVVRPAPGGKDKAPQALESETGERDEALARLEAENQELRAALAARESGAAPVEDPGKNAPETEAKEAAPSRHRGR